MKQCIYIIILLLYCGVVRGQHTTQGKDFWLSFGNNAGNSIEGLSFQVRIVATTKATNVTFYFTNSNHYETIFLDAGSVYTRDLPWDEKQAVYSDIAGTSNKSLHIQADEDVLVYAINLLAHSTDATAILPVVSLGVAYYHASYSPSTGAMDGYTLIATENSTNVYENGTFICELNEGEVYSQYFNYDATGLNITADKPIAYFTTNSRVNVPADTDARDCLYEQLFPVASWGTSFIVPVSIRGIERIRVLASQSGTIVAHTGGTVISGSLNLNAGEYVEIEIYRSQGGCYIEANNPVAVVSYLMGIGYSSLDYSIGDPAITWIPSIEQSVNEIILAPFIASGSSILSEHHILIVAPTIDKNLTEIRIGNNYYTPISGGEWTDNSSGYSFYSMPLTEASLSYSFRNHGGITVLGYGLGNRESYYYLSGSATRKLNAAFYINDIHYQDLDGREFCSDNFDIKAVIRYEMYPGQEHLRWFIDGTEEIAAQDIIQWNKIFTEDTHTISMIVKDEFNDTDTLTVSFTVDIQKIAVSDTTVCEGQSIELKIKNPSENLTYRWYSDADFSDYLFQGLSFITSPLTSGAVFYIEALSSIGCSIRDSLKVNLFPLPELIVGDVDICNDSVATLTVSSANAVSLKWYGEPDYSGLIVSAPSFTTDKLNADTAFYIEALSADGCVARDTARVTVYDASMKDLSVCFGSTAVVSITNKDASLTTWYRNPDFSDIITLAASFETTELKADTSFYLESLSVTGCIAKNEIKIAINPLPELIVRDTNVCAGTTTVFTPVSDAALLNWYSDENYSNSLAKTWSYSTEPADDAVLYVEALSDEGCITRDSFEITVVQRPVIVAMDDRYLCRSENEIDLVVLQSEGTVSWNVDYTSVKPESTREYIATASRPPCPDVHDTVRITVGDSLFIHPSVLPLYQPYGNYSLQLNTNAQSPDYSILRGEIPSGVFMSRSGDLSGRPDGNNQIYVFTVRVEDENQCVVTKEYILERDIFVPKIFTPNGDGINDVFMPGWEVVIFDRLGMEIFKGDNGWDGSYKNKPALQDIYFYTLTRKLQNGEVKTYNGYVGIQ
ncbi:MAG: gliding motility-associated C-terminal domain-containing protein [Prevotellaceae bacterium]|nr:gliding motility-associated C-terminal domain-containing protein [Prevotellaceae bacterium]